MQNKLAEKRQMAATSRRTFAIGDIHGCAHELEELIQKLQLRAQDRVVFLGDYVDRGPDSRGVIDLILKLKKKCEVICLKGNHEDMFLDFLERPASKGAGLFILNGGSATLSSYAWQGGSFEIPREHIEFLYDLKVSFETDEYFFVHAGVPLQPLSEISAEDETLLLWSREPFLSSKYDWGKIIVHGHTPVESVEMRPNRINLDTGCVYEGVLSAMELSSRTLYQVRRSSSYRGVVPQLFDQARIAVRFDGRLPVSAGKVGGPQHSFETLNYNQFGLLMREAAVREAPLLKNGDRIEGMIGQESSVQTVGHDPVEFSGEVVRTETRSGSAVYAIRIERITDGSEGRKWIDRPAEAAAVDASTTKKRTN